MKSLIIAFSITLFASIAGAASYDVGYGSLDAPDDFTFKHIGTIDSFMGTLTRKSDGFTISFDIGKMAGTGMVPSMRDKCTFFRTHKINGKFAWTGIQQGEGKRTITTTIYDYGERSRRMSEEVSAMFKLPPDQREQTARELNKRLAQLPKDPPPPANFSADLVRESDLADFLLIVATYRPKGPTTNPTLPAVNDIIGFAADKQDVPENIKMTEKGIKEILATWHSVTNEQWSGRYSHMPLLDQTGTITLRDGTTVRWLVRAGGLALLTFPDGSNVYLAKATPQ